MKRVIFLFVMLVALLTVRAQEVGVTPGDPAFMEKYAKFDFKGKFAAAIDKDAANNYFLLDFSKLPARFERVYFMNLSFSSDKLVNIDPDIAKSRVCFMSSNKFTVDEVIKTLDEIKEKVSSVASSWPEDKKSTWLKENDKYK
jgi:hypothetical protein